MVAIIQSYPPNQPFSIQTFAEKIPSICLHLKGESRIPTSFASQKPQRLVCLFKPNRSMVMWECVSFLSAGVVWICLDQLKDSSFKTCVCKLYMRLWGLSKIVVPQMTIEVISPEIMIHCTGTQLSCLPNGPLGYRYFGEPPEKSEWVG